jgi:Protein of unknown function (DUF3570)
VEYASADQWLAAFDAMTYGLKYGIKIDDARQELSLRVEYYEQRLTRCPSGLDLALARRIGRRRTSIAPKGA